jgi:hypothetical protein
MGIVWCPRYLVNTRKLALRKICMEPRRLLRVLSISRVISLWFDGTLCTSEPWMCWRRRRSSKPARLSRSQSDSLYYANEQFGWSRDMLNTLDVSKVCEASLFAIFCASPDDSSVSKERDSWVVHRKRFLGLKLDYQYAYDPPRCYELLYEVLIISSQIDFICLEMLVYLNMSTYGLWFTPQRL